MMFKTLAALGINIQLIATSEIKISVVIDESLLDEGVRALHQAFLTVDVADESRNGSLEELASIGTAILSPVGGTGIGD